MSDIVDPTEVLWYCCECGGQAEYLEPSMDARHPLGRCKADPPCRGRVLISSSLTEVMGYVVQRRELRAQRLHKRHLADERLVGGCRFCDQVRAHRRHLDRGAYDNACHLCRAARDRTRVARHVG